MSQSGSVLGGAPFYTVAPRADRVGELSVRVSLVGRRHVGQLALFCGVPLKRWVRSWARPRVD